MSPKKTSQEIFQTTTNEPLRMEIRRLNELVAFKKLKSTSSEVIAFHGKNLEVAEISDEAFSEMTVITLKTSSIPELGPSKNTTEALSQLQTWDQEAVENIKNGHIDFGIRSITINVTQICNLKCHYCAAGGDGTYGDPVAKISIEKTLPQLKFLIEKLKPGQKFNISFVGGEPLLYPEAIASIYDYVVELQKTIVFKPSFMVTTNATLVSQQVLQILTSRRIHITVSLDGPATINDVVRPTKNGESSTGLTIQGLEKFKAHKEQLASYGISAVISKEYLDVISSYQFFRQFEPDWYEFNFSYTETDSDAQAQFLQEIEKCADLAFNLGGETELRKIKTFDHYFRLLDSQQRIENHCGAGKTYLMIDARNQLYTCPWVVGEKDEIVGTGSYLDLNKLQMYQKPLIELNNCQTCWARYLCGGGCMYIHKAHTGDKHTKDILFCERTRGLILLAIWYYKRCRE